METLSASLAFVRAIHQSAVDSLHKGPMMRNFVFVVVAVVVSLNTLVNKQSSDR